MKIAIIEDEYPAADRLKTLLRKASSEVEILVVLESVASAINWLAQEMGQVDLIFSDIQLSDGLSFEIFESIPVNTPIIFTTAYDEYAIKAFKVKSIDYLLKPVKISEIQASLEKYNSLKKSFIENQFQSQMHSLLNYIKKDSIKTYKNRFLVKSRDQLIPVLTEEIAYFYTLHDLVYIVRANGKRFTIDFKLEQLKELLDPERFYRLNRQIICNLSSIERIHPYFNGRLKLQLNPAFDKDVIVSRERARDFKKWLGADH